MPKFNPQLLPDDSSQFPSLFKPWNIFNAFSFVTLSKKAFPRETIQDCERMLKCLLVMTLSRCCSLPILVAVYFLTVKKLVFLHYFHFRITPIPQLCEQSSLNIRMRVASIVDKSALDLLAFIQTRRRCRIPREDFKPVPIGAVKFNSSPIETINHAITFKSTFKSGSRIAAYSNAAQATRIKRVRVTNPESNFGGSCPPSFHLASRKLLQMLDFESQPKQTRTAIQNDLTKPRLEIGNSSEHERWHSRNA